MPDRSERGHQSPSRGETASSSPFEAILSAIGADGKFQVALLVGFMLPLSFYVSIAAFSTHFLLATPSHYCHVPRSDLIVNISDEDWRRITLPIETDSHGRRRLSHCEMYNITTEFDDVLNQSVLILDTSTPTGCQFGWEYDLKTWPETLTSHFDWVCEKAFVVPTITTVITVGSALGTLVFSVLSDSYGRRFVFYTAVAMNLVFGMGSLFATNWKFFAVCRFLEAMAFSSTWLLPYVIVLEICSKKLRGLMIGLASIAGNLGTLTSAGVGNVLAHWKTFGIFCHLPAALIFISMPFLPESPRWLISKRRLRDCEPIVYKVAFINRSRRSRDLPTLLQKAQLEEQKDSSILDIFRNPRLLLYLFINSVSSVIYTSILYGIVSHVQGRVTTNKFLNYGILSLIEVPGNILCLLMAKFVGRRMTTMTSYVLTSVFCLTASATIHNPWALMTTCFMAKVFITTVHTTAFMHIGEIFPTPFRSRAYGLVLTLSMLASIIVPSVFAVGSHDLRLPYFIFGALSVLGGALSSLLPETLGQPLPQTVEDSLRIARNQPFATWVHHWNKKRYLPIDPNDQETVDSLKHSGDADEKEEGERGEKTEENEKMSEKEVRE